MKKLLLILGLITSLIFSGGNYVNAQEIIKQKETLEISESVRRYGKKLEKISSGEHVLVRLSEKVGTYIVTSRKGCHVDFLAKRIGVKPVISNRNYFNYDIGFNSSNPILGKMAERLDKNRDGIIDLNELSEIY